MYFSNNHRSIETNVAREYIKIVRNVDEKEQS